MKKSLLTLAVIAAASLSQAASLNWTLSGTQAVKEGDDLSQYTVMLFMTSQTRNGEAYNFGKASTTLDTVIDLADSGKYDDLASLAAVTKSLSSAGGIGGATGYNGNNFGAGDALSAFALIIDKDQTKYFTTGSASASWTSSTGAKPLAFGTQANATYKSFGSSTPTIPEPATGALALAGIALLFRRRK